jgi:hypothetical protein
METFGETVRSLLQEAYNDPCKDFNVNIPKPLETVTIINMLVRAKQASIFIFTQKSKRF